MHSAILAPILVVLLAFSPGAHSQAPARMHQIGLLANSAPLVGLPGNEASRSFLDALRERGWVDGKTLLIHWRSAEDRYERRPALITELLSVPVEVLIVSDQFAARDAMKLTRTVPIVAVGLGDDRTVADSLSKPGGNLTGLMANPGPEMIGKNLSLLKQVAPGISNVAFLVPWYGTADPDDWPEFTEPARALGLRMIFQKYESVEDIETAIEQAARRGACALYADAWQPLYRKENQTNFVCSALPSAIAYRPCTSTRAAPITAAYLPTRAI